MGLRILGPFASEDLSTDPEEEPVAQGAKDLDGDAERSTASPGGCFLGVVVDIAGRRKGGPVDIAGLPERVRSMAPVCGGKVRSISLVGGRGSGSLRCPAHRIVPERRPAAGIAAADSRTMDPALRPSLHEIVPFGLQHFPHFAPGLRLPR